MGAIYAAKCDLQRNITAHEETVYPVLHFDKKGHEKTDRGTYDYQSAENKHLSLNGMTTA